MSKRIKLSSYKITAKSIINENIGRCTGSFLLIYGPRVLLIFFVFATIFLAHGGLLPVYAAAIIGVLLSCFTLIIDSFTIALGELFLSSLSEAYCGETDAEINTFRKLSVHLRKAGLQKLLALRVKMLFYVAKDTFISILPVAIVILSIFLFAGSLAVPVEAFAVAAIGMILALLTARTEVLMEYDKYRFLYMRDGFFSEDTLLNDSDVVFTASLQNCSRVSGIVKKCEKSFSLWKMFVLVTLPLVLPLVYFSVYKKVTMYNIVYKTRPSLPRDTGTFETQTIVFSLAGELVSGHNAY